MMSDSYECANTEAELPRIPCVRDSIADFSQKLSRKKQTL